MKFNQSIELSLNSKNKINNLMKSEDFVINPQHLTKIWSSDKSNLGIQFEENINSNIDNLSKNLNKYYNGIFNVYTSLNWIKTDCICPFYTHILSGIFGLI